jgi:hypothetical protein
VVPEDSARFCPFCGFNFLEPAVPRILADPTDTWRVPWEERATLGLFQGYWQTTKAVLLNPTQSFNRLASATGRWWDPLSYAIFSAFFGVSGIAVFYLSVFGTVGIATLLQDQWKMRVPEGVFVGVIVVAAILFFLILIPVNAIIRAFVWGGVEHLMLKLVGVSTRGFEATLRGACYATAPMLIGIVPICGVQVYPVWEIVCRILAYRGVHRTTTGKAAAAVLLPLALCCVGVVTLYALFFAAMLAASGAFKR